jgi:hypothetical protein
LNGVNPLTPTHVINISQAPQGWQNNPKYVYIGRKWRGFPLGSIWGNRYRVEEWGRDVAIKKYGADVEASLQDPLQADYFKRVQGLQGRVLVCYCKPKSCHGDVLAYWADRTGGLENKQIGPLIHLEEKWVRLAQENLNLWSQFNKEEQNIKANYYAEQDKKRFLVELGLPDVRDPTSLKNVLKDNMAAPYDRQLMWKVYRQEHGE